MISWLNGSFLGGWWSGYSEKGSQGLFNGYIIRDFIARQLIFISGFTYIISRIRLIREIGAFSRSSCLPQDCNLGASKQCQFHAHSIYGSPHCHWRIAYLFLLNLSLFVVRRSNDLLWGHRAMLYASQRAYSLSCIPPRSALIPTPFFTLHLFFCALDVSSFVPPRTRITPSIGELIDVNPDDRLDSPLRQYQQSATATRIGTGERVRVVFFFHPSPSLYIYLSFFFLHIFSIFAEVSRSDSSAC